MSSEEAKRLCNRAESARVQASNLSHRAKELRVEASSDYREGRKIRAALIQAVRDACDAKD